MWSDGLIKATANASGNATGYLGPCPEGFAWYVERYTTYVLTSGSPQCEIYALNTPINVGNLPLPDKSGRQDWSADGKNDISDNKTPVYIEAGYYLVAVWTSCNASDPCQLSTQIRVHQMPPVVATPFDRGSLTEGPLVPVYDPAREAV